MSLLVPLLLGLACSPEPVNDAIGWNGLGMPLPPATGAGGMKGPDEGAAGFGPDTGAAGREPITGAAGAAPTTTGGAGETGGGPATGAAGATTGAAGRGGTPDAGISGAAGSSAQRDGGAAGAPPTTGPVGATCRMEVSVTTKDTGRGSYAPRNVGAIWIETGAGKFIKSLNVWASKRINHLDAWNASTTAAGLSRNRVDAVTGSTMSNHGTRTATWSCTDINKQPVAAGAYRVCFELNDTNSTSKSNCVPVTVGSTAATVMPADSLPSFTARKLIFTP